MKHLIVIASLAMAGIGAAASSANAQSAIDSYCTLEGEFASSTVNIRDQGIPETNVIAYVDALGPEKLFSAIPVTMRNAIIYTVFSTPVDADQAEGDQIEMCLDRNNATGYGD